MLAKVKKKWGKKGNFIHFSVQKSSNITPKKNIYIYMYIVMCTRELFKHFFLTTIFIYLWNIIVTHDELIHIYNIGLDDRVPDYLHCTYISEI